MPPRFGCDFCFLSSNLRSMLVFDLRIPLGYLFVTLGLLLIIAGFSTTSQSTAPNLSLNVNVIWGGVMIGFGILSLILAKREARRRKRATKR